MWQDKKVIVTGGCGMIGKELVKKLIDLGADVTVYDINANDSNVPNEAYWISEDATVYTNVLTTFGEINPDYVFHLLGVKGNPKMTKEKPVDFMEPMLLFDTNVISVCQYLGVKKMLYTSSIAVENMESDFYPAWSKKTAEHLIDAMRIQYPNGTKYVVVRPANVFGVEDLSRDNLMVVSSIIKRALKEKKVVIDIKGGKQERDLIPAKEVARQMILAMEGDYSYPLNLSSGSGFIISNVAEHIAVELGLPTEYRNLNLVLGPEKKILTNSFLSYDLHETDIIQGLKEVCDAYRDSPL